jgi:hypothetical protein
MKNKHQYVNIQAIDSDCRENAYFHFSLDTSTETSLHLHMKDRKDCRSSEASKCPIR